MEKPTPPPSRWHCDICGDLGPVEEKKEPQHTSWMCRFVKMFEELV